MYKKLTDVNKDLQELRENGIKRGFDVGFNWNDFPYTVKLGTTTYIAGAPSVGKTELQKEILINLSCLHGWKHVIWSPETGSPADIFAELCHAYIGKPYEKHNYQMSEVEKTQAEFFISEHFFIIDNEDEDLTIDDFYKEVDKIEIMEGVKIHTTTIDPFNELSEVYIQSDLGREDKYISRILSQVRKNARKSNRHNFILTHVRDQAMTTTNGVSYFPFPHAREIAGGQTWFRKGMTVILLWRPPFGITDSLERPYGEFELQVRIGKVKPKGTSKKGTYILNLDVHKYQYYTIGEEGKTFADRKEHSKNRVEKIETLKIEPNKDFESEFVEAGDSPF